MNPIFKDYEEKERTGTRGQYEMGTHLPDCVFWVRRSVKGSFLSSHCIAKFDNKTRQFDFLINKPSERDKSIIRKLNLIERDGFMLCIGCYGWGVFWRQHYNLYTCSVCGGSGRMEPVPSQLTLEMIDEEISKHLARSNQNG